MENMRDLHYFSLTLGAGMAQLTVTARQAAGILFSIALWRFTCVAISDRFWGPSRVLSSKHFARNVKLSLTSVQCLD